MRRREFVGLLGGAAAAWPLAARAQPADRVPRIGALFSGAVEQMRAAFGDDPFGLRDLGYIEGKTIDIERRFADGRTDRLPALAAELVALKPDVIIAAAEGVYAVRRATSTIPIVMALGPDLVGLGFAASFAHPGGNITGTTFFPFELYAKRLELLKRAVPSLTRCGVLMLKGSPSNPLAMDAMAAVAKASNVELLEIEIAGKGYEDAFKTAGAFNGLLVGDAGQLMGDAATILSLANQRLIPTVGAPAFAAAGALIGYGVNFPELWRRAALFVDKILKGANPGDIPIERASRFHTVVNLKTAALLGLEVPPSVLAGADEVIE
jgi:putative ABC transport system substrate-binding protein